MHPLPQRLFTEEEYLLIERAAAHKSEYLNGAIYAMAGAGQQHGRIVASVVTSLYNQFRGRSCDVFAGDMRVRVTDGGLYTYPDVVALCGEVRMLDGHADTLLNPQLIIEVLSPSTADYDRGAKGVLYRQLESLSDYVLIEQGRVWVQHWSRQERSTWKVAEYTQASDRLRIDPLQVDLSLTDIYERVVFPPQVLPPPR